MSQPIVGYPSELKSSRFRYMTMERIREHQQGASVIAHTFLRTVASDAVEALTTTSIIVATAHLALAGDVISFTSGTQSGKEIKVDSVTVNSITLAEDLPVAPVAADTFDILRHKYAAVSATGGTITASSQGRSKVDIIRNDYTGTPVTTVAYVQILAATSAIINKISIFDSSGETLFLAVGAAAAEVDQIYIFPGGNGDVELLIPAGSRLSVKAVSATASVGELTINCFS